MGESAHIQGQNRRALPRIDTDCPVLFRDRNQPKWALGRLLNFSQEGVLLVSDMPAHAGQIVSLQLRPDKDQTVQGCGTVSRCNQKENGEYIVAIGNIDWHATCKSSTRHGHNSASLAAFPRISANCQARYYDSVSQRWLMGHLIDLSATSLLLQIDEPLLEGSDITLHVEPGNRKNVPALRCLGRVVHCDLTDNSDLQATVSILRIETPRQTSHTFPGEPDQQGND